MEIGEFGVGRPDFGGRRPRGEALGQIPALGAPGLGLEFELDVDHRQESSRACMSWTTCWRSSAEVAVTESARACSYYSVFNFAGTENGVNCVGWALLAVPVYFRRFWVLFSVFKVMDTF